MVYCHSSDKLGQLFVEMSTIFGVLPDTLGNILDSDQACLWSTEFNIDSAPPLFPEQQAAIDSITATQCGLLLLTGGPGSGKTHLTQRLAHAFAAGGRSVLLSATTGAAAVNLSKSASTVHENFVIPVTGFFRPLPMHSVILKRQLNTRMMRTRRTSLT
ncbi:hypothetical protein CEUSTIGMA_g13233.t1 [Chlamydomonas eustigma]|uniref:ATP-dependent DNA helicase n=1 Tax=Chlamydomonas eustigma TaxID=1157962 RepID=A0A250XRX9_9CHLO|nr:hypothetical protein CEUSTIGMA_g13233.t1 [Chlamydomonas eustigma]|eukprot:GAX85818.1 hypothetical protein CEUSTIGMA_g13233.t1 [Chlamydomonas eustigma]